MTEKRLNGGDEVEVEIPCPAGHWPTQEIGTIGTALMGWCRECHKRFWLTGRWAGRWSKS
jgi:hypothetical protein